MARAFVKDPELSKDRIIKVLSVAVLDAKRCLENPDRSDLSVRKAIDRLNSALKAMAYHKYMRAMLASRKQEKSRKK